MCEDNKNEFLFRYVVDNGEKTHEVIDTCQPSSAPVLWTGFDSNISPEVLTEHSSQITTEPKLGYITGMKRVDRRFINFSVTVDTDHDDCHVLLSHPYVSELDMNRPLNDVEHGLNTVYRTIIRNMSEGGSVIESLADRIFENDFSNKTRIVFMAGHIAFLYFREYSSNHTQAIINKFISSWERYVSMIDGDDSILVRPTNSRSSSSDVSKIYTVADSNFGLSDASE